MDDEEALELVKETSKKFAEAGIPWRLARYGVLGFYVGESKVPQQHDGSDRLSLAEESARIWNEEFSTIPNPYTDLIQFLKSGGTFIRWEQGILDVFCPSGKKYGLPGQYFVRVLDES